MTYTPIVSAELPLHHRLFSGDLQMTAPDGRLEPLSRFASLRDMTEASLEIDCMTLTLGVNALVENPTMRISLRVAVSSVQHPRWLTLLDDILRDHPYAGDRLILALSEGAVIQSMEPISAFMHNFQIHNVSFALSNFGAGLTSFHCLRDLPFDMVIIGPELIRGLAANTDNQIIVQSLITVAHQFFMFAIADGISNAQDAETLARLGIDCMQGPHIGAPRTRP